MKALHNNLAGLQTRLGPVKVIVIDEVSTLTSNALGIIDMVSVPCYAEPAHPVSMLQVEYSIPL